MYQVDKSKIFSVRYFKSEVNNNVKHLPEVKNLFGRVIFKSGYYLGGLYNKNNLINPSFIVFGKACYRPYVVIKFKENVSEKSKFYFDSEEEAIEFFNLMTKPDSPVTQY